MKIIIFWTILLSFFAQGEACEVCYKRLKFENDLLREIYRDLEKDRNPNQEFMMFINACRYTMLEAMEVVSECPKRMDGWKPEYL